MQKKQLEEFLNSKGFYSVHYIGYCVDEENRYKNRVNTKCLREIYPLVENNIKEDFILEWAKEQSIYNDYYKFNRRCGCMFCPMASMIDHAYFLKYYPENYSYMIEKAKETEKVREKELGKPFSIWQSNSKYNTDYRDKLIHQKWLPKLDEIIKKYKRKN